MLYQWIHNYPVNFINPQRMEVHLHFLPFYFKWRCLIFLWQQGLLSQASTCMYHAFTELCPLGWAKSKQMPLSPGHATLAYNTTSWELDGFSAHVLPQLGTSGPPTLYGTHSLLLSSPAALGSWKNHYHEPAQIPLHMNLWKSFT